MYNFTSTGCVFSILYFVVYRELGENMTDEELRAMIDEFDRDGDGESKCLIILKKNSNNETQIMMKALPFFFNKCNFFFPFLN